MVLNALLYINGKQRQSDLQMHNSWDILNENDSWVPEIDCDNIRSKHINTMCYGHNVEVSDPLTRKADNMIEICLELLKSTSS